MAKLRVQISMSLDGYMAGPDQSLDEPLGIGGEQLHEWVVPLEAFSVAHGRTGGEVNESTPVAESHFENIGASLMGRNMFGGGPGPWGDDPWPGFWGEEPPYHHPVFVLTHHERDPLELSDTTFHFVTDGPEAALDRAREAAAGKDVLINGGAQTIQQYLRAGLLDEMLISLVPVLLGGGARLLDDLGDPPPSLEQVEVIAAPGVTHLKYRRVG